MATTDWGQYPGHTALSTTASGTASGTGTVYVGNLTNMFADNPVHNSMPRAAKREKLTLVEELQLELKEWLT